MEFATDKETKVTVNGKIRTVSVTRLTYAAVCALAEQPLGATVIFDRKDDHRSMFDGEHVEVESGLRFTVVMTDNA